MAGWAAVCGTLFPENRIQEWFKLGVRLFHLAGHRRYPRRVSARGYMVEELVLNRQEASGNASMHIGAALECAAIGRKLIL